MPTHSFVSARAERHPRGVGTSVFFCCVRDCGAHVRTHTHRDVGILPSEVHHRPSITAAGQRNDTANCAAVRGQ